MDLCFFKVGFALKPFSFQNLQGPRPNKFGTEPLPQAHLNGCSRVLERGSQLAKRPAFGTWLLGSYERSPRKGGAKQNTKPRSYEMNTKQSINTERQMPSQLRAVLTIAMADQELRLKALPFVDIERQEVNWSEIFKNDLGSGHRAALLWAKSLYRDEAPARVDAFDRALAMDGTLRRAVVQAIKIRWSVP